MSEMQNQPVPGEPDFDALKDAVAAIRRVVTHLRKTKADPELLAEVE